MLFIIMMTISMGIMNLILAVIVERAAEATQLGEKMSLLFVLFFLCEALGGER